MMFLKCMSITLVMIFHQCALLESANILVLAVFPFFSHIMTITKMANELANRGHNVTYVTIKGKAECSNLNLIQIKNVADEKLMPLFMKDIYTRSPYEQQTALWKLGVDAMPLVFQLDEIRKFIDAKVDTESESSSVYNTKYDAVITETYFDHEAIGAAFSQKYNCPLINYQPIVTPPYASYMLGNPYNPSYMVDFKLRFTRDMNFFQRVESFLLAVRQIIYHNLIYLPELDKIIKDHFSSNGSKDWPYIKDILRARGAVTLVDAHHVLTDPLPQNPDVIDVGGLHIKPAKPLPKDLEEFMNNSKHGVIYFAMGSHVDAKTLEQWRIDIFIKVFSSIKENVIWKLDDPNLSKKVSKNVKLGTWFPQNDILAHPNCKLFITHGGVHGTFESIYHKVPMLVIGVFSDQIQNGIKASQKKYGEMISFHTLTYEEVQHKMNQILRDPIYKQKISEISNIFRSDTLHPMERTMQAIEYVIDHKGANHLKTKAVELYWFQYLCLDVILFFVLLVSIVLQSFRKLLIFIRDFYFSNNQKGKIKNQKSIKKKIN